MGPSLGRRRQTAAAGALKYLSERQLEDHDARRIPDLERVGTGITAPAQSLSPNFSRRLEGLQVGRIGIAKFNAVLGFMKLPTIEVIEKEQRNGDSPSALSKLQRYQLRGARAWTQVRSHL